MNRFTIVIPTRGSGQAPYLEHTLQSLFLQNSSQWRALIVDGGEVPLQLPDDARLSVLRLGSRRGLAVALNQAMRQLETPFLAMLHDDDLLVPEAVAVLSEALANHPEADYFYSSRRFIDDQGRFLSDVYSCPPHVTPADFVDSCPVKHWHCWRVAAALELGGVDEDVQLHGGDDYDFPWRMCETGFKFQPVPQCLYHQRDHRRAERLTTDVPLDSQLDILRRIFRKHGLSESQIEQQLQRRQAGYLQQALFQDDRDRQEKTRQGFDRKQGWRELPLPS